MARSMSLVSRSPTTEPMLPMMNAESVTAIATRRARIMPVPHKAASVRPVRACSEVSRSAYDFLSENRRGSEGKTCSSWASKVPSSSNWAIRSQADT